MPPGQSRPAMESRRGAVTAPTSHRIRSGGSGDVTRHHADDDRRDHHSGDHHQHQERHREHRVDNRPQSGPDRGQVDPGGTRTPGDSRHALTAGPESRPPARDTRTNVEHRDPRLRHQGAPPFPRGPVRLRVGLPRDTLPRDTKSTPPDPRNHAGPTNGSSPTNGSRPANHSSLTHHSSHRHLLSRTYVRKL